MAKQVHMVVTFENGQMKIEIPHGRAQQVDASKVEDLTLKLAEAMGEVTERHVGDHHHHDHGHDHGHNHQTA
jgi:hypothetical protein